MTHVSVICLFFVLGIFSKGVPAVIQTQQTVVAAVGEQACLKCQFTQSKDVLQVTWQKILPDGKKNLATFSKNFGARVNAGLSKKADFLYSELKNCSMVIKKVTEEDEGCYHCLFNTFPGGAVTGTTCLRVYELHEPVLHVRESNSSAESFVSCSATGRPAPNVTLTVTQQPFSFLHHNTVSVSNTNGTVTVTATAVLSGFHNNSIQVGCAARVPSGPQMEAFVILPEPKQMSDHGASKKERSDSESNSTWIILSAVCVVVGGCVATIIAIQLRQKQNGDPERTKTPQKTTQDTHQITPLIKKENELIRLRSSSKKRPENNHPKPSPSTAKRLFEDDNQT
ncbi:OX-2 membrane glycoprotein-like isoform X1 [Melanotaenia boesemani]|uniref:OX-2 membrane glycoprotein-like isoform X1 n=2 Tax=Melanotaenia boesemani TaxID=1250792 RepID=UPI001C042D76|nr:OX-2 membrane glycoprotein-like isoform X1 [Melanotaenia boesemani]XP_041834537.1 OX-2 membrane glycoprotein-like isoform X1 [Melanotaenia boesemani]